MERDMASPTEPKVDMKDGRLLTEWFEFPTYDPEALRKEALQKYDTSEEELAGVRPTDGTELAMLQHKVTQFVASHKKRRWTGNMTQQEVQMRLNEATKMVDPSNYKFLPDDVRERTGLELNPLWMMECLVRSGVLAPKEMIPALKELASYTYSKAPSISHNTNTSLTPEDWLLELAKDEYEEIEVVQPKTIAEKGAGKNYESNMARRVKAHKGMDLHIASEMEDMMAMIEDDWIEVNDGS